MTVSEARDKLKSALEKYREARRELMNAQLQVIRAEESLKLAMAKEYINIKESAKASGEKITEAELKERVTLAVKSDIEMLTAAKSDKARAEYWFDVAEQNLKSVRALVNYIASKGGEA